MRQVEGREWWLWGFAVAVTLVLTFGILSLTFPGFHLPTDGIYTLTLKEWVRALVALVLLFDIYTIYQHLLLQRVRHQLAESGKLFRLITENAEDMIAVVDMNGHRRYNSPAYQRVLGYSPEELAATSANDQIHPDDRARVVQAAEKARATGAGERLEYRIRHHDGSWRVLESTASAIPGPNGEIEGLVVVNRDITDRKRAEDLLVHNAFHDGLTDLPNRALFLDRLERTIAIGRRHADFKFAVLFIDIDGFKVINDSLGHAAGDALLVQIAQRLSACLRRVDTISRSRIASRAEPPAGENTLARPGGDEFAVLAEDLRDPSDAIRVAERIRRSSPLPLLSVLTRLVSQRVLESCFGGMWATRLPKNCSATPRSRCTAPNIPGKLAARSLTMRCTRVLSSVCNSKQICAEPSNWVNFSCITSRLYRCATGESWALKP